MATVGKWGIARDDDGSLSNLREWPWFWRYPCGLLILGAGIALGLSVLGSKHDPSGYIVIGAGVLLGLGLMYELGCLVFVLAIAWLAWALGDAFLPRVEASLGFKLGALGAGVAVACVFAYNAYQAAQVQAKTIENIWARLSRLEGEPDGNPATLAGLTRRVRRLEREAGIKLGESLDD